MVLNQLANIEEFTRKEYYDAYRSEFGEKSPYVLDYALRKAIAKGCLVHVGRNRYSFTKSKRFYTHTYSQEACDVAQLLQSEYPFVDFQIFELTQLNEFVNHLIARNTIFISVENVAIDFVFDTLHNIYPGKVLLKPKEEEYYRYLVEGQIVLIRLPSESPKGLSVAWQSGLEKILVDISVDKLLSRMVYGGELQRIFDGAFDNYFLDMGTMLRYANRKGAGTKFIECLKKHRSLMLEVENDCKRKLQ